MIPPILEDIKNETRRLSGLKQVNEYPDEVDFIEMVEEAGCMKAIFYDGIEKNGYVKCPYGKPGDVLWVRETWKKNTIPMGWPYHYLAANDTFTHPEYEKWKPSIHMPRVAARIFLEVLSVTVERLQQITEEGAISEGVERYIYSGKSSYYAYKDYLNRPVKSEEDILSALASYKSLWTKLHGEDSWKHNPWVWVIKFKFLKDYDARK